MHILLAYGDGNLTKKLKAALLQGGYQASILPEGVPPKARYDAIFQLAHDPARTAEGTRLLLNKARHDRSRLFLVGWRLDDRLYAEAFRFAQTLIEEAVKKGEVEATILNLGRLFGPGIPVADSGALGHLINEFSQGNILTLYGGGADSDYYLSVDDAVEGLVLALTQAKSGEIYALAPSIPITSEAIAKLLYDLGGGRHEMIFHRGLSATAEKGEVPGKPLPEFKVKTPFHEGILTILKSAPPASRTRAKMHLPQLRLPLIHLRLPHLSSRVAKATGIMLLLLSPFIYLGSEIGLTAFQLNRTKSALEELNFARAESAASSAAAGLTRLGKAFPAVRPLEEVSRAVVEIASQGTVITTILENLTKSWRGEPTQPQSTDDFRALATALSSAEDRLTVAWLESQQINLGWLKEPAEKLQTAIEEGLRVIRLGSAFARDAEDLLGYRGERNYLILFQNSTELRSTGGFFGTLAQLTLENGAIQKLEFFDSYQFTSAGKIPYYPAGQALMGAGETPLYDVNVEPSFPKAARDIAALFAAAQGLSIHGVIGTTLGLAQNLLAVTGSLELSEFERTVTAENLFAVATEEAEKDFFPGSQKKKRLLQSLGEGLLEKVFSLSKSQYLSLADQSWRALQSRDLLLYFETGDFPQALFGLDFDGHLAQTSGDYLGIFDNNYSAKVNEVLVKRKIDYRVFSPDKSGTARGELTVTWDHTGTDSWPSNTYHNLLLVLTPKGSKLMGAFVNDANYYNTYQFEEENKTGFAAYFVIPHSATTTFKLIYELPAEFHFDRLKKYRLTVQKQPGTAGDPFTFRFEPSIGQQAVSSALKIEDGKGIFEGNLSTDLEFEIETKER